MPSIKRSSRTLDLAIFIMTAIIGLVAMTRTAVAWDHWDAAPKIIWPLVTIATFVCIALQLVKLINHNADK